MKTRNNLWAIFIKIDLVRKKITSNKKIKKMGLALVLKESGSLKRLSLKANVER